MIMMNEFVVVFPSNVQPHIFPNNTAGHYYTLFDNPIVLHGQWQVAVKDVSYVHNIQTIKDESLVLGIVDDPQLTFPNLEHANMLVTYDMNVHQYEWMMETRRNLYGRMTLSRDYGLSSRPLWVPNVSTKEESYQHEQNEDRIYAMLNILNRIGKHLWFWYYNQQKICFKYTCTLPDVSYAFFLSEELRKALHMPHKLLVPMGVHPMANAQQYSSKCLSDKIKIITEWDTSKFQITLLPLHRMKKRIISIPDCDVDTFIQHVTTKMEQYGLTVRRTKPKDDTQLTWVYKNTFENQSTVAFIHFNDAMVHQLQCHHNIVVNPVKYVGHVQNPKSITGAKMTVYLKEVTPPPYKMEKWSMTSQINLPSKYYASPNELLQVLNKGKDYSFSFDKSKRRFVLNVVNRRVVEMSERLKKILGFDKSVFFNETCQASHSPLLDKNIHHFYLYSNIVVPTYVGGAEVPLLRYIPITNAEYGQTLFVEWNNLTYLPVSVSELRQVELALYDDTGERVNFEDGRTVVTLHFRKI